MRESGPSFLRKYENREATREAAAKAASGAFPETETEERPTIGEVLRTDSKAFGQMLESQGDPELADMMIRFQNGATTEADVKGLSTQLDTFLDMKARIEKIDSYLENTAGRLRENSEKYKEFNKTYGTENVSSVTKEGLSEIAFADPKRFEKIEKKFAALEASDNALNDPESPVNKKLVEFCRTYSLNEDALMEVMGEKDDITRGAKMYELLSGQLNWFQRLYSGKRMNAGVTEIAKLKTQADIERADNIMLAKEGGDFLVALISKDDTLRNALMRTQTGERPAFKEGVETKLSFTEAKNGPGIDLPEIGRWWPQFLKNQGVKDFAHASSKMQNVLRDRFRKEYTDHKLKEQKKAGGFWATILSFLFSNKLNTPEVNKLLN